MIHATIIAALGDKSMTVKIQEDQAFVDIPLSEPKASKTKSADQVQLQLQDIINTMRENVALATNRGESLQSIQQKSRNGFLNRYHHYH